MSDFLYLWPEAAKFSRRIPKEKFYEQGNISAAIRDRFVSEVARITWEYKLAEATINLPASAEVPEIQVFSLDAKGADVSEQVLAAIDKAVPSPIIFEITKEARDGIRVRMTAAHKQLGAKAPHLSKYFTTGWVDGSVERQPLPTAINLPTLYVALLEPLTGIAARPGEKVSDLAGKIREISNLEREIAALERKIKNEKQLNRKIEIRRVLKTKQAQLEQQR